MQTSLVIGGGGFIGRLLCSALAERGVTVHATARSEEPIPGANLVRYLDIVDPDATRRVISEHPYDVVYFLAAVTEHHKLVEDPMGTLEAYVAAALNVARAVTEGSTRRLVFSSTGKVYGDTRGRPISEEDAIAPSNVLGRIKVISENILRFAFTGKTDKNLVLARIFNVYGPGQKSSFVVPTIIQQLQRGSRVHLGNLDDGRDYLYIHDLINALVLLGHVPLSAAIEAVNVGTGHSRSVRDILALMEAATGQSIEVCQRSDKLRHDENSMESADVQKLRRWGWEPATTFDEGIRITVKAMAPDLLA